MGKLSPVYGPPPENAVMPRYPVYIPSRGRYQWERALTARWLASDRVPFVIVCVPSEREQYEELVKRLDFDGVTLLSMEKDNEPGTGAVPVRNWIKDHSIANGAERHWQLDDNTYGFYRLYKQRRIPCRGGLALRVCEDFTDRYENVAISGLNYDMFGIHQPKPFVANVHIYSCTLIRNDIPHRWRGRYNDDTDLCLQVLADGWCTILLNAFLIKKKWTMQVKGGMTDSMYAGDGRLAMAKALERKWPYVVETHRRFQRPQHVIRYSWRKFDTPLKLKEGVDLSALPAHDEYGMELRTYAPVTGRLAKLYEAYEAERAAITDAGDAEEGEVLVLEEPEAATT